MWPFRKERAEDPHNAIERASKRIKQQTEALQAANRSTAAVNDRIKRDLSVLDRLREGGKGLDDALKGAAK